MDKDGYWLDCHFLTGACDSYENGKRHFLYSKIASQKEDFGFAISHLVLGAEEMIKALILVCLHGDLHFIDTKDKEKIFRHHTFKHVNIKDFLSSLTNDSQEDYESNILEYSIYSEECGNKYQATSIFLSKSLNLGVIDEAEIEKLNQLLDSANDFKNKGFYVDYRFDWKTPSDISKETYEDFENLANKLTSFIEPIFTLPLTDEKIMNFLMD